MRFLCSLLLVIASHAATITVTVVNDAGATVSTSTTTTTDAVISAFQVRMATELTRQAERANQGKQTGAVTPPSVADAIKMLIERMMPHPPDEAMKALDQQIADLQTKRAALAAAQVK
jgi:hypothetical protein